MTSTYLDYNATAPLHPEARDAMVAALDVIGNASSVHEPGRRARAVVETARDKVADFVGAEASEVIFTSGATEANNWVMAGGWERIILAPIEHESIYVPALNSKSHVDEVRVDENGVADVGQIAERVLLSNDFSFDEPARTAITLQVANNETGALQPVAQTAAFARQHGLFMHTDAVQGAGRVSLDFHALGVDAMSLSAHKIGGPKGIGALVLKDYVAMPTFIQGGGQERRRRAGTENVAAIAGFGAAVEAAGRELENIKRIATLRDQLEVGLKDIDPDIAVLSIDVPRIANTTCFAAPGKRAETTLIRLDLAGVAVSSGAACSSGKVGISRALDAMRVPKDLAQSAIRISIGHATTEDEIRHFLKVWKALHHSDKAAA